MLRYPQDFYQESTVIVEKKIKATEEIKLTGSIQFDLPFSDWQISLFNMNKAKSKSAEQSMMQMELLADGGPLKQHGKKQGQTTVKREISYILTPDRDEEMDLRLVFAEEQASVVLKAVLAWATNLPDLSLCLPVGLDLSIKQLTQTQQAPVIQSSSPLVSGFKLLHQHDKTMREADSIPRSTKVVQLITQFNKEP